jgi:hypothetical protein
MLTKGLLSVIPGLLALPLTILSCDRPSFPAEPTIRPLASAAGGSEGEPLAVQPSSRPICNIAPADGHAAIIAAIDACPNGSTVLFPPHESYTITDRIEVKSRHDLVIDGNGSTFTNTRAPTPPTGVQKPNWWLENNTDLVVRNMTVRGAFDASISRPGTPPVWQNIQWEHGFTVVGGVGIWIQDVAVTNVWGEFVCTQPLNGIEGSGGEPRNVHIERLTGSGAARNGVAFVGCIDCWLEHSTLSNVFLMGIDLEPDVPNEFVRRIHIRNVAVNGVFGAPVAIPFKFSPGDIADIEIRGLTMSQSSDICYAAVQIGYPEQQENTTILHGIVIEDNQFKSKYHGVILKDVGSGSVRNNHIENTAVEQSLALCGPPAPEAVRLASSPDVLVSGNTPMAY